MLSSMTGFADINENFNKYQINISIKSLNHKYLNITYKINEELYTLEQIINTLINSKINRGKIDLKIKVTYTKEADSLKINNDLLQKLLNINDKIIKQNAKILPMNVSNLLQFPNIITNNNALEMSLCSKIINLSEFTINELIKNKNNEGEKLAEIIIIKINELQQIQQKMANKIPKLIENYQEKLREKLVKILLEIEDHRLQQEFAYFIQKYDIDEELSRTKILLQEFKTIIQNNNYKAIGKKLDFMIQELNREINTIASKSISIEITQLAIQAKVLLEQIREQIQNIE